MKILLDTHVILWALQDNPMLPLSIRDTLIDENNEIYVSSVSLWEIAIKHKVHPENMRFSANQIRDYCQRAGYIFLSLNLDAISVFDNLEKINHKDPFDLILACQSSAHNMKLITHDKKIKELGIGNIELI